MQRNHDIFRSRFKRFLDGKPLLQEEAVTTYNQLNSRNYRGYSRYNPAFTNASEKITQQYAPTDLNLNPNLRPDLSSLILDSTSLAATISDMITGYVNDLKHDSNRRTQLMNAIINNNLEYLQDTLNIIKELPEEQQKDVFLAKDINGMSALDHSNKSTKILDIITKNSDMWLTLLYKTINCGGDIAAKALKNSSEEELDELRKYGKQLQGKYARTDDVVTAIDDFRAKKKEFAQETLKGNFAKALDPIVDNSSWASRIISKIAGQQAR